MKKIILLSILSLFVYPVLPSAKGSEIGLNIGYFYPSSSSVRDLYGNSWLLTGIFLQINEYQAYREVRTEYISLDYIHNSHNGEFEGYPYRASVTNIPLMYNTRYRNSGKNFYYVYGIGFNYLKVKVEMGGTSDSDSELDLGGQLALGYGTDKFGVELRYIEFGRTGNTGLALTLMGRF
ncbi:hypothetical protein H5T87_05975 [bacterium]|nr:hypothetical protein [bacterium]